MAVLPTAWMSEKFIESKSLGEFLLGQGLLGEDGGRAVGAFVALRRIE